MIVTEAVTRRAADIAVKCHHLASGGRADRHRDVEQPVGETEVHHLARDIGMAAVDARAAEHLHIGGNHGEERVFGRCQNLRARIDLDPRSRTGRACKGKIAAEFGEILEAGVSRVERRQHQRADIEGRGAANQQPGGRIEGDEAARNRRARDVLELRDHRPVDHRNIAVGGRQDAVEHREIGGRGRLKDCGVAGRQEIERVAGCILGRNPVDHHSVREHVDLVDIGGDGVDLGRAEHHRAIGIDCLRLGLLRRDGQCQRQCRAAAAQQKARTAPVQVNHLNTSTGTGGQSAKTGSAHRPW